MLVGHQVAERVVDCDVVAVGSEVAGDSGDVFPPEKDEILLIVDRAHIGRDVVFGRMDSDPARLQAFHCVCDEARASGDRPEMLQAARRPDEVEAPEFVGDLVHIDVPKRNLPVECLRVTQAELIELAQIGGMLVGFDPPRALGAVWMEVGGDDLAAKPGEEGNERFSPHTKPEASAPRSEHPPLVKRLRDIAELPQLPVQLERRADPPGPCAEGLGLELGLMTDVGSEHGTTPRKASGRDTEPFRSGA